MMSGKKYPILLALTLSLAPYALRPPGAQAQSISAPAGAKTPKDLTVPVPEGELQTFETDFITLQGVLYDMNGRHPEAQSSIVDSEKKLATLTPEEWTMLANAYDRAALSQSGRIELIRLRRAIALPRRHPCREFGAMKGTRVFEIAGVVHATRRRRLAPSGYSPAGAGIAIREHRC